jgi:hypothetical protein
VRALVVYESMFGNTARIAEAIGDGLGRHLEVRLQSVTEQGGDVVADLLVVGGPTHAFSMSRASTRQDAVKQGAGSDPSFGLREWLEGLPMSEGARLATFDTRVEMVRRVPGSAAKAAAKAATKRGYRLLTRPESFYVEDTPGPLLDGEVHRAVVWGSQLGAAMVGQTREWG